MKTIKGPAIFLAQFMGDEAPFNSLDSIVYTFIVLELHKLALVFFNAVVKYCLTKLSRVNEIIVRANK